jgi:hypothetical protein
MRMLDDLLKRRLMLGMPKKQVFQLLGTEFVEPWQKRPANVYFYHVAEYPTGDETDSPLIVLLEVEFDSHDLLSWMGEEVV